MKLNNSSESQIRRAPEPGVRGFLLLFCLILIFGTPFVAIYNLINDFQNASGDFDYIPGLRLFLIVESGIRATIILFSILAGASILSLWSSAILLTRAYLITFLCSLLLGIALLFLLVEFPVDYYDLVLRKLSFETISSLLYFVVCYLYINFSKRVRVTFPESFPEKKTIKHDRSKEQ
ncbi:MAG TPA: DUF2569 family protein [Candidatus Hydrogenedens sp.]|nr:DUF2569 family protein [Candidatus Hydrogenedens sp.]HOL19941.1 DUF2569 family protein [Candidatus Hydrogenedens sp.]HPP58442.1 DUF2569 family protein [Candidatus Hydrogenedens sp.]